MPLPPVGRTPLVHPLDPLSAAEVRVAIDTVRAAGKTPEVPPTPVTPRFATIREASGGG